ncbi:MAG: hypothetical protein ABIW82_06225 [Dokdonella sp.]
MLTIAALIVALIAASLLSTATSRMHALSIYNVSIENRLSEARPQ